MIIFCVEYITISAAIFLDSTKLIRKIINIYNDLAGKHQNVTVKDLRKYEKLEYKKNWN